MYWSSKKEKYSFRDKLKIGHVTEDRNMRLFLAQCSVRLRTITYPNSQFNIKNTIQRDLIIDFFYGCPLAQVASLPLQGVSLNHQYLHRVCM